MEPLSNQQSSTSAVRRKVLPSRRITIGSMRCLWRSVTRWPLSCSSSAMEPTQIISGTRPGRRSATGMSSTQTGMQEPQKRLRLMFQSFASRSQLPNRLSPIAAGIQCTPALWPARRSRMSSTFTYHASIAR